MSYPVNGGQSALLAGLGKALAGTCGNVAWSAPTASRETSSPSC